MKKIYTIAMILFSVSAWADCSKVPDGLNIKQAIEAKSYDNAKSLLETFKTDIKTYLTTCDKSEAMFEQTSVNILMYEDKLADLKHDIENKGTSIDCSKVPSSTLVEKAFKAKNTAEVKTQYAKYKKEAHDYIEHCASHAEYETVFESSMFCEEMYDEWIQKNK
jgi:hypothetical protein